MMNRIVFASILLLFIQICGNISADEPTDADDLSSEYKGVKLLSLRHISHSDGFECTLYTDAEYESLKEKHRAAIAKKTPLGNRPLGGMYEILEVKKDRIVLVRADWSEPRRIRVIPLAKIASIYRAGNYEKGMEQDSSQ